MTAWIKDNIPWIVTSIVTLLMGYAAGQVKVSAIEARIAAIEAQHLEQRLCRIEAIQGMGDCKR